MDNPESTTAVPPPPDDYPKYHAFVIGDSRLSGFTRYSNPHTSEYQLHNIIKKGARILDVVPDLR